MKTRILTLLTFATLAVCAADSQRLIPFQGRLTNQQGEPYTEGRYTIVFNLYDAPVGGTALWTERHESVGLINGMVNVFLGSIADLSGQDFSKMRYLGITIDTDGNANTPDPEMVPRQMIIPAFYAKDSEKLQGADWSAILANGSTDPRTGYIAGARLAEKGIAADKLADNGVTTATIKDGNVTSSKIAGGSILPDHISPEALATLASSFLPPGVIMPYSGAVDNIPTGWLPCDGRAVSSAQYPRLFEAIGTTWGSQSNTSGNDATYFKLPDLRNRTLWGANKKALGTYVAPGLPNITGSVTGFTTHGLSHTGAFSANGSSGDNAKGVGSSWYVQGFSFNAANSSSIYGAADTVQPPAAAVNFIIKVDQAF